MKMLSKTFLKNESAGEQNTFLLIDVALCRSIVHGTSLRAALMEELARMGYEASEAEFNADALDFMVSQRFIETPLTELHRASLLVR